MNGVNFFTWIRDGVRQSVLLGVSDAVEQLGTPASNEDIHPSVAGLFAPKASHSISETSTAGMPRGDNSRKRLGRSLKDLNAPKPAE